MDKIEQERLYQKQHEIESQQQQKQQNLNQKKVLNVLLLFTLIFLTILILINHVSINFQIINNKHDNMVTNNIEQVNANGDLDVLSADRFPLRTHGRNVVDNTGKTVRMRCVNWYGAHLHKASVGGLNVNKMDYITKLILDSGFNCVRLVYSLDLVYEKVSIPNKTETLKANPELFDKSPMEIFDLAVESLTNNNIIVVLNNHNSDAGWCCDEYDNNGMWYNDNYTENMWLNHLAFMSRRYINNPFVAAFDIRNEIRATEKLSPVWYSGNETVDWATAAYKGGKIVAQNNKDMLVIVGGVNYNLDLQDVHLFPLHEKPELKNKLVYSSHSYDWSKAWDLEDYNGFERQLDGDWGYLVKEDIAPVWLGEFGTAERTGYWIFLMKYIADKKLDYSYWALDGQKEDLDDTEVFGILNPDYATYQNIKVLRDFAPTGYPKMYENYPGTLQEEETEEEKTDLDLEKEA